MTSTPSRRTRTDRLMAYYKREGGRDAISRPCSPDDRPPFTAAGPGEILGRDIGDDPCAGRSVKGSRVAVSDLLFRPAQPRMPCKSSVLPDRQPVELSGAAPALPESGLNRRGLGWSPCGPDGGVSLRPAYPVAARGGDQHLAVSAPLRARAWAGPDRSPDPGGRARCMRRNRNRRRPAQPGCPAPLPPLGFQEGRILELDLGDGPEPVMYLGMSLATAGTTSASANVPQPAIQRQRARPVRPRPTSCIRMDGYSTTT
jgi:hypothetical protein